MLIYFNLEMVNVIEDSESDDQAKCLVRKFNNPHDKSTNNDKFECCVDKNKTVRKFIHLVSQHYNLDVDSFYLTFSSHRSSFSSCSLNSDSTSEARTKDKVFVT